jgi:uncharacterized membrane protein
MTNKHLAEHSIVLHSNLESVWQKLIDWQNMPGWDIFMKSIQFDEPVGIGSIGALVLKNGQRHSLRITQFEHLHSYTDEFSVLGMRFVFFHRLTPEQSNKVTLYFSIDCTGPLSFIFRPLLTEQMKSQLQILMENFRAQLEKTEKPIS